MPNKLFKKGLVLGILVLFIVLVIVPISFGYNNKISDKEDQIFDCINYQQKKIKNTAKILTLPVHDYDTQSVSLNKAIGSLYNHIILDIFTPFTIANIENEFVYININCKTKGSGPSRYIYITVWCEDEIYDDWVSKDLIPPGTDGYNMYPFKVKKMYDKNSLDFTVETGHLLFDYRIKDDQVKFSIPIGKYNTVPDQICTKMASGYCEMCKNSSCPFFQEITTGISGNRF